MREAAVAVRRVLGRLRTDHTKISRHLTISTTGLRSSLVSAARSAAAPVANAASELLGDLPTYVSRARTAGSPVLMQASPSDSTDAPRPAGLGARFRLDAFLQHRQRLVPTGLAALLVVVAAISAMPVAPASVSAGSPPSRAPRVEIAGLAGLRAPVEYQTAADGTDQAAAATDAGFVEGTQVNVPRGARVPVDAKNLLKSYTVQPGDTAVGIAAKFGVNVYTVYWANKSQLKDPQSIWPGQTLVIPPVNGLIVTVAENDTLESLAAKYGTTTQAIVETNNLNDPILITGDTLIIPGAKGEAMPTPKPEPTPTVKPKPKTGGYTPPVVTGPIPRYTGRLLWPVFGGSISQRFWSGHPALDIAAPYGTGVRAAAAGTVIYAGWRSYSGGGNVIWISHGGLYTTYNHLSAWYVSRGQTVAAGQKIGAIGLSGITTGPHLHFEVWTAYPWSHYTTYGIQNPCYYLGC